MITNEATVMSVAGLTVYVTRKPIKNIHLSVNPPDGAVRVSAPESTSNDNVRLRIIERLAWIKRQRAAFKNQPRQSTRRLVSGETHYFLGRGYRLSVQHTSGASGVSLQNGSRMQLVVPKDASVEKREKLLDQWYRTELKVRIPKLISKWEPAIDRSVAEWGVKRMKTKWGSCNTDDARLWINLELAKKPLECLEYIVVHEMVHLLERSHNDVFKGHMNRLLPDWRMRRDLLNSAPLAHVGWQY